MIGTPMNKETRLAVALRWSIPGTIRFAVLKAQADALKGKILNNDNIDDYLRSNKRARCNLPPVEGIGSFEDLLTAITNKNKRQQAARETKASIVVRDAQCSYQGLHSYILSLRGSDLIYVGKSTNVEARFKGHIRAISTLSTVFGKAYGFDVAQVRLEFLVALDTPESALHSYFEPASVFPNPSQGWFIRNQTIDRLIEYAKTHGNLPTPDEWDKLFNPETVLQGAE